MSSLTPLQKSRIRFHLSITDAVPSGDLFYANQRLEVPRDESTISLIKRNLDGLDQTYQLMTDPDSVTRTEVITGDVNRSIVNTEVGPKTIVARYKMQCNLLADSLGVRNFRFEPLNDMAFSSVISHIVRPDGSSVGSRILMAESWS